MKPRSSQGGARRRALAGCLLVPYVLFGQMARASPETPAGAATLLARGSQPLMMAGEDHAVLPHPNASREENPLGPVVKASALVLADKGDVIAATGISRNDYLKMIEGVVAYFGHFQGADGRIVDPFLHREYQYSTPAYALAASMVGSARKDPDMLASAARALDSALYQLASGTAADRHGDFFILPAMLAYRQLLPQVDVPTRARWASYMAMIDPDIAYSDLIGDGQPDVINWNSSAIAGEFLRHKDGFSGSGFVDRYLDAQLPRFTSAGLYRDPGAPLVYDAAARFNFLMLLDEGYDGEHRDALEILLERGAWASLLMQSPSGDFPTGGRSVDHVWNDALLCASFERWARKSLAKGDLVAAKAFKRGAHLAARSIGRWARPSGEFWIVKNHFDPALRRGFESYSSHSQYNLLAAAYLAMAWSAADESISEGASPADVGGFVFALPEFRKIFANSGGHYIEIEAGADPHHDSTGLLRVNRRHMANALGPATNSAIQTLPLAVGVAWPARSAWESLAQFPSDKVETSLSIGSMTPDLVDFQVRYALTGAAVRGVTEHYRLSPDLLSVTADIDGPVSRWKLSFPAFLGEGKVASDLDIAGKRVIVRADGGSQSLAILSPRAAQMQRTGHVVGMRSGDYEVIEASGPGRRVTYSLGPAPAPAADKKTGLRP